MIRLFKSLVAAGSSLCFLKKRRLEPAATSLLFIVILATTVFFIKKAGYHVIYSATNSMPKGFYLVVPSKNIQQNDIVEFTPPKHIIDFVKDLHWLPQSNTLIKYVFAISGDYVCVCDNAIWVNHKLIGRVYAEYEPKKPLPQTQICSKLKTNEYLLLSTKQERSFDGRYFGATTIDSIKGKAIPIFIDGYFGSRRL